MPSFPENRNLQNVGHELAQDKFYAKLYLTCYFGLLPIFYEITLSSGQLSIITVWLVKTTYVALLLIEKCWEFLQIVGAVYGCGSVNLVELHFKLVYSLREAIYKMRVRHMWHSPDTKQMPIGHFVFDILLFSSYQ